VMHMSKSTLLLMDRLLQPLDIGVAVYPHFR
jgi:hypothetical protein